MTSKWLLFILLFVASNPLLAQNFTRRDSLQGGFSFERMCFDVQRYDLSITVNPEKKYLFGSNTITFKMNQKSGKIQLDLFENMQVDSIVFNTKKVAFTREFDAVFVQFSTPLEVENDLYQLQFYYSGFPKIAKNAPWDGGFVFEKDKNNKPWIGVAVQGTGASLWFPVKDSQSDEPDLGISVKVAVPQGLMNVSNGRFKGSVDLQNGYKRWDWEVLKPINSYNITINIGDYVHLKDKYQNLDLDYYVLRGNEKIAKKQFQVVKPMMACFESKFGSYPFTEDSFKLIETNYLGMEHQSAVSYGNKYKKGYLGSDLSGTGIGLLFDYIIIHETAHEWFGNSVTSRDIADMWIHESFTTYAESVFVECQLGKEKAIEYINGQKRLVQNSNPILGKYGVNDKGSGDMYYKGSLVLNTLRNAIDDDEKWWRILKKFTESNRLKIIETKDVINYFSAEAGWNLTPFFTQYLQFSTIPHLETKITDTAFSYRWKTNVTDFELPMFIRVNQQKIKLNPTSDWNEILVEKNAQVEIPTHLFYITK